MKEKLIILSAVFFLSVCFLGCFGGGSSDSSSSNGSNESAGGTSIPGLGDLGKLKDMAENIEKAAKDLEEGKTKKPVNFRKIKEFLPASAAGVPRENAKGETTGTMGFTISQATGMYKHESRDNKEQIEVKIVDGAGVQIAFMGLAAWSLTNIDKEDDNGFERTTNYKGGKAYQKYNSKRQRGEFVAIAGERFIVTVSGRYVTMDQIEDVMDNIDLDGLAQLKSEEE